MTQAAFTEADKIGRIVTVYPGASNLLKRYDIDFCCGGGRAIGGALEEKGLDAESVLAELNAGYEKSLTQDGKDRDWQQATMTELITHVVQKHHAYLKEELPVLGEFVTKILRVHGARHGELAELHRCFHTLKMELEQHLVSEEEQMFPLVCEFEREPDAGKLAAAQNVIAELESEHTGAGDLLKRMREITDGYTLPDGACRTYTLTFQKLEEMESDLFEHIHLENNILFPRVMETTI